MKIKENEKRDKYLELAKEKKVMQHESDGDNSCNWCTRNGLQRLGKETGISPSDCLVSYPELSFGGGYPSAGVQSTYSTAIAN